MPNQLDREQQLRRLRERYARRNKDGKARMLDEFCEQHGYSRKHAIKLLGDWLPKPTGQSPRGPEPKYLPVREVLQHIWERAAILRQTAGSGAALVAAALRQSGRYWPLIASPPV